ncbi:Gx transporter family protein [uncultured Parvimonas sp.]|uniref:Gx transporter family protein n=1 Tax=uncultured Parvimonas sp. TaxID=747372 RepID=UPI00288B186B|nr:Gx transporter family protein [uncultured Parvimonas sp.]
MSAKKTMLISLFVCVALIVSLLEYYIPIPIPNVRLGLSNVIIINAILIFGFKETFFISFLKAILLVIILGNPISFIYNFSAGFASIVVMYIVNKFCSKFLSLVGVSVLGSVSHIMVQILISMILLNTKTLVNFIPFLGIIGIFTGILVGILANYMYKILRGNYVK